MSLLAVLPTTWAQLYGQWPMGGLNERHAGYAYVSRSYSFTAGTERWHIHLPSNVNAVTGVAIGAYQAGDNGDCSYRVYFGASDNKVYRYLIQRSYGQWSATSEWTYTCDGTPVGTPVLAVAGTNNAVYVSDDSGRVHCLKESDGSRLWRSADLTSSGQTITPPLYCKRGADTDEVYRVYVGRDNGDSTGNLLGFPANASDGATPDMAYPDPYYNPDTSIPPVVSTPAAATISSLGYDYWRVYLVTADGSLGQLIDHGGYGTVDRGWSTWYGDDCTTWPTIAGPDQVYHGVWADDGYTTDHAVVYGNHNRGQNLWDLDTRWPDLLDGRVETAQTWQLPPTQVPIGKIVSNPCTDLGTTPNVFWATSAESSDPSVNAPTFVRVVDLASDNDLQHGTANPYLLYGPSVAVTSTPIYRVRGSSKRLVYVTPDGKLYAVDPTLGTSLIGWPKTVATSIPKHDLAHDETGAIVFITSDGYVRAYWGT